MKLSRLFVLGAMGLASLSANAIELEAWEEPSAADVQETAVAFEVGKTYILYNTGAEMYFTQGSNWSTRGCVVPNKASAVKVRVAKYTIDNVWDGKTYEIQNYVTNRSSYSWYKLCMNAAGDLYLDQTSWARFLEIQDQGSNVYRLMPSEQNATIEGYEAMVSDGTQFIGYAGLAYDGGNDSYGFDDASERVPLSALTTENVDWVFYDFSAYDAYEKSSELKALIEKADEAGVDVSAAVTVFNNHNSTVAQIEAAMKALNEAIAAQSGIGSGTAANPSDATVLITNPDFDDASSAGWSGTAPNMVGSGSHGPANVAEVYNNTFDTYQDLAGMPKGVYGLSAYTTFRGSWADYQDGLEAAAKLYATADGTTIEHAFDNMWSALNTVSMAGATEFGTTAAENSQVDGEVTYYTPNDPSAARLYFEKGYYHNAVVFSTTDYTARIGVKNPAKNGTGDNWSIFDTFRLTYYGNEGAASYAAWLGDNAAKLYAAEALATPSYIEEFTSALNSLKASATDAASANAAYESAKQSQELADLKQNISLWGQWVAALNKATDYTTGDYQGLSAAAELGEYIGWEGEEQQNDPTWDNATIQEEIAKIAAMVQAVKDELSRNVTPGTEVTEIYIGKDDAAFTNGKGEWTLDGNCNFGSGAAEAYNQQFDLYKVIDGPQVGVYELQLQGFFRLQRDQTAFDLYNNGEQVKTYAWIYLNDVKSYVTCVFDETVPGGVFDDGTSAGGGYWTDSNTDNWYPNTMASAAECFDHDMYKTKAYGLVANAGEQLRLGVAGDMTTFSGASGKGANWMIWDNFKLTYVGFDAATIKPILEDALQNMESLDEPMGKSTYDNAVKAKADAESALSSNDGTAMFEALKAIWASNSEIPASVALFKSLKTALEGLEEMFNDATNEDAIAEASEFKEEVQGNIDDHKYDDDDVPALLAKIKGFRYKLRMPAEIVAGTDLTAVLETPEYSDDEGAASSEGWEGTVVGTNGDVLNAEIFNTTPFDHYQEIPGLPAGTYEVTVKAFYRAGGYVADYDAYTEGKDSCDNVVLYANNASVKIHRLAEFADATHAGESGWAEVATGNGTYVPNSMSTAATLFDEQGDAVVNTVYAYIEDGETLRLGLKKDEGVDTDWCLFDNWTLTYYGVNSSEEQSEDPMAINAVNAAKESLGLSDEQIIIERNVDEMTKLRKLNNLVILRLNILS